MEKTTTERRRITQEGSNFKGSQHDNCVGETSSAPAEQSDHSRFERRRRLTRPSPGWFTSRAYVARSKQEGRDVLPFIESVGQTYNAKIVYFSRTSELIDYMNNGPAGRPRSQFRIASWEFFGHSNKACLMFDYSNNLDSGSKCWLHEKELAQIQRGVFTRNAFVKSWGCYCGELFVKSWYKATGTRMWGAIGKTQYND
jgi:hypothetical protein